MFIQPLHSFLVPMPNVEQYMTSFKYRAVVIWTWLPLDIRKARMLMNFGIEIRNIILRKYIRMSHVCYILWSYLFLWRHLYYPHIHGFYFALHYAHVTVLSIVSCLILDWHSKTLIFAMSSQILSILSICSHIHEIGNVWHRKLKWFEHSVSIPVLGFGVPFRSRHFLSQNHQRLHNNIQSCVENERSCSHTVGISNISKNIYTDRASIPNMR